MIISGIILCGLSLIVPWGEYNVISGNLSAGSLQFYSWGGQFSSISLFNLQTQNGWFVYFIMFTDSVAFQIIGNNFLVWVFSIFILPISLFTLAFGIQAYQSLYYKEDEFRNKLRDAGILAIMAIVFFYILIQFGISSDMAILNQYYQWSAGFYMVLLNAILFLFVYLLTGEINIFEKKADVRETRPVRESIALREIPDKKPEPNVTVNMSKFCYNCGSKLENAPSFCGECGVKLR